MYPRESVLRDTQNNHYKVRYDKVEDGVVSVTLIEGFVQPVLPLEYEGMNMHEKVPFVHSLSTDVDKLST